MAILRIRHHMLRNPTMAVADLLTTRFRPRAVRAGGRLHLTLYRLLRGAGPIGADTMILTTHGRVSRRLRSTPLYYVEILGRRYVAASFAGSDTPPQWYLNAMARPEVDVQIRGRHLPHVARELAPDESDPIWSELKALYPPFARYQRRTARRIPVIELTPAAPRYSDGPPG